jgi:hypothetical protein
MSKIEIAVILPSSNESSLYSERPGFNPDSITSYPDWTYLLFTPTLSVNCGWITFTGGRAA